MYTNIVHRLFDVRIAIKCAMVIVSHPLKRVGYFIFYGIANELIGNLQRHDLDLVAVVKALGKKANGDCSSLAIAEIKGDTYRIEAYDGAEEVITPDSEFEWIHISQ